MNPTPGQTYICRGFRFRVDFVADGQVYVSRWPLDRRSAFDISDKKIRVFLAVWEKEMADAQEVKS